MGKITGSLSLPTPQCTSQLINDTRFSSIREYLLNSSVLSNTTSLDIADISSGSVIYKIDLIILSAFNDNTGNQHDIEISYGNNNVLMNSKWNDPNTVGTYTTNCYAIIRSEEDIIHINHTLANAVSGSALLRFYIYTNS